MPDKHSERMTSLLRRYETFVETELIPHELRWLQQPADALWPELEAVRKQVRDQGLWAPYLPEKDGGLGLTMMEFAVISERLAMTPFGHYVCNCQAPDIGNVELLHTHASPAQRRQFLQPLIEGKIRSCFSMTEPGFAGSNPVAMGTTAVREGDGYIINGHKWFTTAADGAAFAVVMAVSHPDAETHKRASMFIVPSDTPGFQLLRNIPVMGESGHGWLSHGEIRYHNCRIPEDYLLGPPGEGFRLAQERLGPGRIHHCMRWLGIAERAFRLMVARSIKRDMGDGSCLGDKQVIQHWIAESRASIDAARLLVLHTAEQLDREGSKAARHGISMIKFHVAAVLDQVLDRALQVHGALGLTEDTPLSFWYRHERGARIYDGPDEVHKSSLARSILKQWSSTQKGNAHG
jgi:alkylation response protein AidB-like acyl-CoA dehydrogenase